MTCHFVLPFSVWGHASLIQAKRDLRKEKFRSPNDAWKRYLKTWDWSNSQSFLDPSCKGHRADIHWVIAYDHKTQSFNEKGGQQKCLDKTLLL